MLTLRFTEDYEESVSLFGFLLLTLRFTENQEDSISLFGFLLLTLRFTEDYEESVSLLGFLLLTFLFSKRKVSYCLWSSTVTVTPSRSMVPVYSTDSGFLNSARRS